MIKFKRIISSILVITMIMSLLSFVPIGAAGTGTTTYKYDGYTVEYIIKSGWDQTQNIEIKIINTGDKSINNWAIKYECGGTIKELWNAAIFSHKDKDYIIKSVSSNNEIKPNMSVNFGYAVVGADKKPTNFELVSKTIAKLDGYTAKYVTTSEWSTGFEGTVTISNSTSVPIDGWSLSFDTDATINNLWNASKINKTGTTYIVAGQYGTATIPANGSISFGLNGSKLAGSAVALKNFALTETVIADDSSVPEKPDVDWEDSTDTDADGLPDVYEINITKTDPKKADTDGDRLPDGYEVFTLGTDPTLQDSDKNGITDDAEDNDSDGLTNYQEFLNKTDPNSNDSDGDGLSDGDEINIHKTNPLMFDTDGDTIGDGDEIKLGLNPTTSHTTNGVLDSEVKFEQNISNTVTDSVNADDNPFTVDINVTATGYADRNLTVGESGYASVISNNEAIQGSPIELAYENGSVEKTKIKFNLDNSLVSAASSERTATATPLERYHIFRYDEEYNLLYPVNTIEDGNSIYTESDKLGTYCVMDLVEWDKSLQDSTAAQPAPMMANFSLPAVDNSIEDSTDIGIEMKPSTEQEPLTEEEQQEKIAEAERLMQEAEQELYTSEQQKGRARAAGQKMDFVVAIDSTGSMKVSIDPTVNNYINSTASLSRYFILKLMISLNRQNVDWRMQLIDYKLYPDDNARTVYTAPDGTEWFTKSTDVVTALDEIEVKTKAAKETSQTPWDALGRAVKEVKFRDGAVRHSILLTDQGYQNANRYGIKDISEMKDSLESNGIYAHHLTPVLELINYIPLRATKGVFWYFEDDFILYFPQKVVNDIIAKPMKEIPQDSTDVKVVTSFGLETIDTNNILGTHLLEDLDGDGLDNMSEINFEMLLSANSVRDLITLKEFSEKIDPSTIGGFSKELLEKYASLLVLPLKSDPRMEDSDGDSYTYNGKHYDYTDKNDPTPLRKDVTISKLNNSDGFVEIQSGVTMPYYGGDQSWFGEGTVGESAGCGTVAAANIFAYLAAQNPEKYGSLYNGDPNNITLDDFTKHMGEVYKFVEPITIHFSYSPSDLEFGLGVWPMSLFTKTSNDYAEWYGCLEGLTPQGVEQLHNTVLTIEGNTGYRNSAKKLINTALSKDKPVALLIGLNNRINGVNITYPNEVRDDCEFSRHWVTITEMRDDRISGISDVKVSTWGGYANINLNDIIDGESLYNCFVYFE